MTEIHAQLANRIQGEVTELDRVVKRTSRIWEQANTVTTDQDIYLDSVALNLHSFYSGLEKLFELVARHFEGDLPRGQNWHQALLFQMSQEIPWVRPALIDPERVEALDEFRRFRHLIRNVYATNLRPERMADLLETLPTLWADLKVELLAFADFLEQVANV